MLEMTIQHSDQAPPPDARYGVWDGDKEEWTGVWFYTDDDAGEAMDGYARSGLHQAVSACRDDVDDSWMDDWIFDS